MEFLLWVIGICAVMGLTAVAVRVLEVETPSKNTAGASEWVKSKAQNSRAYMFTKELKWALEQASQMERATILALSALYRGEFAKQLGGLMLTNPLVLPREDAVQAMNALQDFRDQLMESFRQAEANMKRIGIAQPTRMREQAERDRRAIEVSMMTVAVAVRPESRDDARACWEMLIGSKTLAPRAIQSLQETERLVAEAIGDYSGAIYNTVDADMWIEACDFVPECFAEI